MALSTTTLTTTAPANTTTSVSAPTGAAAPMLAALVLSVYAAQKGSKQLRKLKRKAAFTLLKLKLKQSFNNFLGKREVGGISTNTLLYILLGLLVLILLFTLPTLVAILVLLIGILLILLTRR
jgi:hypothetical protein